LRRKGYEKDISSCVFSFLSLPIIAQDGKQEASSAKDILVKSEVETAISMLKAICTKHKEGEMSLVQVKKLGADLLR